MESSAIEDTSILDINKENDRVRFVGKLKSFDKSIGTFIIEDNGIEITCIQNYKENIEFNPGELVIVTGRSIPADSSFEIRAESMEKIDINDYNTYKKYLKIRKDLLNNGSGI